MRFFRRNMLFTTGLALYLSVATFRADLLSETIRHSLIYFQELFEILPLIVLMATVIDAWIPKEVILGKLGRDSGKTGALFAYLIGSISAGPIYASFPIVKLLMEKGASVSNAVIIISSWAVIKLPMLVNEVKFLGLKYMAVRWFLTITAIYFMSRVIGGLIEKEDILDQRGGEVLEPIALDPSFCIGCGLCEKVAPEDFGMRNGRGFVRETASLHPGVKKAKESCPGHAIQISESGRLL